MQNKEIKTIQNIDKNNYTFNFPFIIKKLHEITGIERKVIFNLINSNETSYSSFLSRRINYSQERLEKIFKYFADHFYIIYKPDKKYYKNNRKKTMKTNKNKKHKLIRLKEKKLKFHQKEIVDFFKNIMSEKQMSQIELAKAINSNNTYINKVFNLKICLTYAFFVKLCNFFNVRIKL